MRRIDKNDMFTPTSSGKMPRAIQSFRLIRGPTEEHEVWDNTQLRIIGTKDQWHVCGKDLAVNLRVAVADVWLSHGLQKWSHWAGKKKNMAGRSSQLPRTKCWKGSSFLVTAGTKWWGHGVKEVNPRDRWILYMDRHGWWSWWSEIRQPSMQRAKE